MNLPAWLRRRTVSEAPSPPRRAPAGPGYDAWRKAGVTIGKDCILYNDLVLDPLVPHLIEIGDRVAISGGVVILAHDGMPLAFTGKERFARVRIRDNSVVGYRAIILPGVTVGPDSIVGANAVVTKDVPPRTVVGGNPAKPICTLDEYLARLEADPKGLLVEMPWLGKESGDYAARRRELDARLRSMAAAGAFRDV